MLGTKGIISLAAILSAAAFTLLFAAIVYAAPVVPCGAVCGLKCEETKIFFEGNWYIFNLCHEECSICDGGGGGGGGATQCKTASDCKNIDSCTSAVYCTENRLCQYTRISCTPPSPWCINERTRAFYSGSTCVSGSCDFGEPITERCQAGYKCQSGQCICASESDAQFCSRLGKACGSVTAADNCGRSRTVSCGPESASCTVNNAPGTKYCSNGAYSQCVQSCPSCKEYIDGSCQQIRNWIAPGNRGPELTSCVGAWGSKSHWAYVAPAGSLAPGTLASGQCSYCVLDGVKCVPLHGSPDASPVMLQIMSENYCDKNYCDREAGQIFAEHTFTRYANARCNDGADNDCDGKTDLSDPGCASAGDDDETDPTDSCSDYDGNDINVGGYVSGYKSGSFYKKYDYCQKEVVSKTAEYIVEYTCSGSEAVETTLACQSNFECVDTPAGAYCKGKNTCTDTDKGKDIWKYGSVSGYKDGVSYGPQGYYDTCTSDDIPKVNENYCEGAQAKIETISCPDEYECGDGYCIPSHPWCSNLPVTRSPPWQTEPLDYSWCCLNEPAVPGADYAAWRKIAPTTELPGYVVTACRYTDIRCGAAGSSTKGTDGLCPESIMKDFASKNFECKVCDADCSGARECNGWAKGGEVCDSSCNPKGPLVSITGLSLSCTKQDQTATAICTQPPGGFACTSGSERLKFYASRPATCKDKYGEYDLPGKWTFKERGWLCAAALNVAGVPGFSAPEEIKIDKTAPAVSSGTCSPSSPRTTESVLITAPASDVWCGIAKIELFDNGAWKAESSSAPLQYSGAFSYGTHAITATATDKAGNTATGAVCTITPNDNPAASIEKLSGTCSPGQAITIGCAASDANQQASTLSVKAWAGTCDPQNCGYTNAVWSYLNGALMTWDAGLQKFTKSFTIPSGTPAGTKIAATCQATDEKNAVSNWGDRYSLCEIPCTQPTFSNIRASPDPAGAGAVTITFRSSAQLAENPTVDVYLPGQPGRQATYVSNNGNDYVYRYSVLPGDSEGQYNIKVTGRTSQTCTPGSSFGKFVVDTTPLSINSPPDITYAEGSAGNKIVWTATDANPGTYSVTRDGEVLPEYDGRGWSSGFPTTVSVDGLAWRQQPYKYVITVTDAVGLWATDEVRVTVTEVTLPQVSVSHAPASPTTSQQVTFTATASDSSGIEKVEFYVDGILKSTDPTSPYTYTGGSYPEGTHTYKAKAFDNSANKNSATTPTSTFTVIPAPPGITVSVQGAPASCTNQNAVATVSCTGNCDSSSYRLKLYATSPGTCSQAYSDYNLPSPSTMTDYGWLCAAAKNLAGLPAFSAPYEVKIDKTAPAVSSGTCSPSSPRTTESVLITAPASDVWCGIAKIELFDNGAWKAESSSVPLQYSGAFSYGTHAITAKATDKAGNTATGAVCTITPNDNPAASIEKLSGTCSPGQAITIGCAASDLNQPASTLSAKVWLGTCDKDNCFDTRSWAYLEGVPMAWDGQKFTVSYTIPSNAQPGTGISATCQATDEKSAASNWADAYPLCTLSCTPPAFSDITASPSPAWNEDVTITFTSSAQLTGNPSVRVHQAGEPGRQATYAFNIGNDYVYSYKVRPGDAEGAYDIIEVSGTAGPGCSGAGFGSLEVSKTASSVSTAAYCNGGACASKYKDSATITLLCSPQARCDKTYYSTGLGFVQYAGPFVVNKCGTTTIQYYSTGASYTEPIKYLAVNITCDSVYMVPFLTVSKPSVSRGEHTEAIFSCNIMSGNSVVEACAAANTKIIGVDIDVDEDGKKTRHNYMTENGIYNGDERFMERYTAYMFGNIPVAYSNVWVFDIDTSRYHSRINISAIYLPAGLVNSSAFAYGVLGFPSSASMAVSVGFPDVDSGIVPKTQSGYPNYTLSMPVNFIATGKIYSKKKWADCTASNCIAEYRITDEYGALKGYSALDYSTADSAFRGSYNSAWLSCNSNYNLTVGVYARDGSAANATSEKFFINCEPRLIVTPLEARSAVGDRNRPIFSVTMVNPRDTGMNYDFGISSVNADQSFAVGFLKPTRTEIYVGPSDSGVINVYLSDIGAGRSGSFKMKFTVTDSAGREYSSVNYILVFAEGLDEFAAWQLVFLAIAGVLAFYRLDTKQKKAPKKIC